MAEQIPLSDSASAVDPEIDAARNDKTHEIAPDLAYRRLGMWGRRLVGESLGLVPNESFYGPAPATGNGF